MGLNTELLLAVSLWKAVELPQGGALEKEVGRSRTGFEDGSSFQLHADFHQPGLPRCVKTVSWSYCHAMTSKHHDFPTVMGGTLRL